MSYMGKVRPTVALTSSDIVDGAITTDKVVDDAVTADKVANAINTSIAANTSKVTNATHTGDVTGATALTIATDAVDIAMLSATGTADSTTFLRGDNAWASPSGGKVLQVIHITDAGPGTTTSGAGWVDTDTTGAITCSATDSKVLVMFGGSCTGYRASDTDQYTGNYRLYETVTTTAYPSTNYFARGAFNSPVSGSNNRFGTYVGGAWLHSPSSTSELTYTVQLSNVNGITSVYWNETSGETATMTLMEIGA
jgi:hypothetical protein